LLSSSYLAYQSKCCKVFCAAAYTITKHYISNYKMN